MGVKPGSVKPQVISRVLRKAGFMPVPRGREGLHVTGNFYGACVSVDLDSNRRAQEMMGQVVEVLEGEGYQVKVHEGGWVADVQKES